jgi:hypothetical protein
LTDTNRSGIGTALDGGGNTTIGSTVKVWHKREPHTTDAICQQCV